MPNARLSLPAILIAAATIAIGFAWGWAGALVFLFLAVVAWTLAFAVGLGGDWTRDVNRGRFGHPEERDR